MGKARGCLLERITCSASNALTLGIEKASLKVNVSVRYRAVQVTLTPLDSSKLINHHIGVKQFHIVGYRLTEREKNGYVISNRNFVFNFLLHNFLYLFLKHLLFSATGDRIVHNDPRQAQDEKSFESDLQQNRTCWTFSEEQFAKKILLLLGSAVSSPPTLIAKAELRSHTYQRIRTLECHQPCPGRML